MKFSRYNVTAHIDEMVGLFAGMSGEFVTMTADEWRGVETFVAEDHNGHGYEDRLAELVRMRALYPSGANEIDELRTRYDRSRHQSGTLGYTVVTSLGCNFDCPYCFESKKPSLLKAGVADALVDLLRDSLPTINALSVTWMGGEPLVGKAQLLDLSDRFIEICKANDKAYQASIITNGWYLDADTATALVARNVTSAQVTIDGPPDVHNTARPHRNGGGTFDRIVANLQASADIIDIAVRINVDTSNLHRLEELLGLLADAGLSGRVSVGLGRVTDAVSDATAPLASYTTSCLTAPEFSDAELAFHALAAQYGFATPGAPRIVHTPCTAVRKSEIVVGADGEMWKCWDDIGNQDQALGSVFDYSVTNEKLAQWIEYHPADDPQCSSCVAMPVCMGGCAHHHFNSEDPEARCGAFRHNHQARIDGLLRKTMGLAPITTPMRRCHPLLLQPG